MVGGLSTIEARVLGATTVDGTEVLPGLLDQNTLAVGDDPILALQAASSGHTERWRRCETLAR